MTRAEHMTRAERYITHRLRGSGAHEAARAAGFAGGRPSGHAARMWRDVERIRRQPAACVWIPRRLAELEDRLAELEDHLAELRAAARACEVYTMIKEAQDA